MDVPERIDVEVHLVVAAHPAAVYLQVGHHREHVVHRGYRYAGTAVGCDMFRDHVGTGMAEFHHRFVDHQPLGRRLELLAFQKGLEGFYVGYGLPFPPHLACFAPKIPINLKTSKYPSRKQQEREPFQPRIY